MHAHEACSDVEKASMIESFGNLTFRLEPLDSRVATGDSHDGPRMAGSPHQGETGDRIGHDFGETQRILVLCPGAKPAPIHTEVIHLCKLFGENLYRGGNRGPVSTPKPSSGPPRRSKVETAISRRCNTIIAVCPGVATRYGRCCTTLMGGPQTGGHLHRGFSGAHFPISLRAYYRRLTSCLCPGNVVRPSR
jgi:hypothetical protein